MNKTVAILYGFAEGPQIGGKLIKVLRQRGYEVTTDSVNADYIIAHSGGIYFVPSDHKAKLILLDAPSIGDGNTWKNIQWRKAKIDFFHAKKTNKLLHWFYKIFCNVTYFFLRINIQIKMLRLYLNHNHNLPTIKGSEVIVIAHKNDPWSSEISQSVLNSHKNYKLITHIGVHDDLWLNPDFYIDLLTR
jgi:hypothetical protein